MANILISYDVTDKQAHVKASLKNPPYNYMETATLDNETVNFPDTTLWKQGTTVTQAKADMEAVARAHAVRLKRAIAVEFTNMAAIKGDAHTR